MADRTLGTPLAWLVVAALGVLALLRVLDGGNGHPSAPVRIGGTATGAARPAERRPVAVVHVAGAVRRPGLVRVPEGARVAAAISLAGGAAARADLAALNLAARLQDGQQVVVPRRESGTGAADTASARPSLGTATLEELDGIDGIGPTLAERIVEYRTKSGGFASLEELREVDGIGEKRLAALREALQP